MSTLIDVRQEIADQLCKVVKPVPVHVHAGRFDESELKRLAAKCPSIYLAILGLGKIADENSFGVVASVQFGCFLMTRDIPGCPRDESALWLVSTLTTCIAGNDWGVEQVAEGAKNIAARNLYGAQIEKSKVAMWAITWQQNIQMGSVLDQQSFDDLAGFAALNGDSAVSDGAPESQSEIILDQ